MRPRRDPHPERDDSFRSTLFFNCHSSLCPICEHDLRTMMCFDEDPFFVMTLLSAEVRPSPDGTDSEKNGEQIPNRHQEVR